MPFGALHEEEKVRVEQQHAGRGQVFRFLGRPFPKRLSFGALLDIETFDSRNILTLLSDYCNTKGIQAEYIIIPRIVLGALRECLVFGFLE